MGWETMIIQGDMLAQGGTAAKYIAIIRGEPGKVLPTYMRSKYAFNWGAQKGISKKKLNELLLILFDRENEPPLGRAPEFVRRAKKKALNA